MTVTSCGTEGRKHEFLESASGLFSSDRKRKNAKKAQGHRRLENREISDMALPVTATGLSLW
jgi:hypothetical protein